MVRRLRNKKWRGCRRFEQEDDKRAQGELGVDDKHDIQDGFGSLRFRGRPTVKFNICQILLLTGFPSSRISAMTLAAARHSSSWQGRAEICTATGAPSTIPALSETHVSETFLVGLGHLTSSGSALWPQIFRINIFICVEVRYDCRWILLLSATEDGDSNGWTYIQQVPKHGIRWDAVCIMRN